MKTTTENFPFLQQLISNINIFKENLIIIVSKALDQMTKQLLSKENIQSTYTKAIHEIHLQNVDRIQEVEEFSNTL